ncbi:MAG TPA: glycosyltransferase family 4 protein [bacterium]|nr:glycosyltransferase family 4 protein [bacterium]
MKKKKKILFVAFPHSIHAVRWIRQLKNAGWDVAIFPSVDVPEYHPEMPEVASPFISLYLLRNPRTAVRRYGGYFFLLNIFLFLLKWFMVVTSGDIRRRAGKRYLKTQLDMVLRFWRPDIVHSLETQSAGYLVADVKRKWKGRFPVWVHTNWGSDLYLFGRLKVHEERVREVISSCDHYLCECRRDLALAKTFGYAGPVHEPYPNTGGFDVEKVGKLRGVSKTSERKIVLVKGYQHWAGRALVALRALELCADDLKGYEVWLYSVQTDAVTIKAELFAQTTGLPVNIMPLDSSHDAILELFTRSRIYVGLSISDAISTSLLEAMVTGAFPIQSCTSCADEWIVDGKTGFIVPPEDPERVAVAIRRALTDDALVDRAADLNWQRNAERLDAKILAEKTIQLYTNVLEMGKAERNDVQ